MSGAHDELEAARPRSGPASSQAEVVEHGGRASTSVTTCCAAGDARRKTSARRIARDLHDHLGQQLTALRLALERTSRAAAVRAGGDEVERALASDAARSTRLDFLAWELRPRALDDLGLAAALPRYVTRVVGAPRHPGGVPCRRVRERPDLARGRGGLLPHRPGGAEQRRQARARQPCRCHAGDRRTARSCSSSRTTASASIAGSAGIRDRRHRASPACASARR